MRFPAPHTIFHGTAPARIAVLHGGPGGAGEVAPLARALAAHGYDVLEPYQQQSSITGQIGELHSLIIQNGGAPLCLVGWSWGAWLAMLCAATHPDAVSNLVLVGAGPLDAEAAKTIAPTRRARLSADLQRELDQVQSQLHQPDALARFLDIYDIADSYARDDSPSAVVHFDNEIHKKVWAEARALRESGALLECAASIACPVLALHGADDPHPAQTLKRDLCNAVSQIEFRLLPRCGHKPWQERHAKDAFFAALEQVLPKATAL